jgi:beta-lactamase class D
VEWPQGPVIFALNIDTLNGMAETFKRKVIAREILVSIGALPQ